MFVCVGGGGGGGGGYVACEYLIGTLYVFKVICGISTGFLGEHFNISLDAMFTLAMASC